MAALSFTNTARGWHIVKKNKQTKQKEINGYSSQLVLVAVHISNLKETSSDSCVPLPVSFSCAQNSITSPLRSDCRKTTRVKVTMTSSAFPKDTKAVVHHSVRTHTQWFCYTCEDFTLTEYLTLIKTCAQP